MFNIFKKRKNDTKAAGLAAKLSVSVLAFQLETSGFFDENKPFFDGPEGFFVLGYVYGVCDCSCQLVGINDDTRAIAEITLVCIELFGENAGPDICSLMLDMAGEMEGLPSFSEGVMLGGNEASKMHNAALDGGVEHIPMGLARHIRGMPSLAEELEEQSKSVE